MDDKKQPAGWSWGSAGCVGYRGLGPEQRRGLAVAAAVGLAWMGIAAAGVLAVRSEHDALRWLGAALVGLPPVAVPVWLKRRLRRLDEFQALLEARALMLGALWAVAWGAAVFAVSHLLDDPVSSALLALLPPAGFLFGAFMLQVEKQAVAG